jgi:hypothetical protein
MKIRFLFDRFAHLTYLYCDHAETVYIRLLSQFRIHTVRIQQLRGHPSHRIGGSETLGDVSPVGIVESDPKHSDIAQNSFPGVVDRYVCLRNECVNVYERLNREKTSNKRAYVLHVDPRARLTLHADTTVLSQLAKAKRNWLRSNIRRRCVCSCAPERRDLPKGGWIADNV